MHVTSNYVARGNIKTIPTSPPFTNIVFGRGRISIAYRLFIMYLHSEKRYNAILKPPCACGH